MVPAEGCLQLDILMERLWFPAFEGMSTQEEDLLDQELLQEDPDHEEMEDEMEPDPHAKKINWVYMNVYVLFVSISHMTDTHSNTNTVTLIILGMASHSRTGPKLARKCKRFPDSVSYPSYSDINSQAPKPLPFKPSRSFGIDFGSMRQVVRSNSNMMLREIDFFMLFFTQAVVAEICSFTNLQGWELVLNSPSYSSYQGAWMEVTPDEFYKFLGLLIYMGFSILPDSHRHWGIKSLQGSWARGFMLRDRYKALLAALHVVDPTTEDNQDRIRKLHYLIEHLKQKCQQLFQPNQNLTIDERMVKSKARSGFKQHMKGKPTWWSFKLWVTATSDSGYTLDFNVYTGSHDWHVTDLATKVVELLLQPFKDQVHNVWFDNFYMSPALMVKLLEMGTNACGTCRVNRKLFPAEFKDIKRWERKKACGDMRWCRIERNTLVIQWKDTLAVTYLSNFQMRMAQPKLLGL
ncbi:uncharacterized protein LOC127429313 [Myxocyprinus asiaticus]|uniref:uncharacterized protein LOC127429313 n=1 Tax=Myxocyprinus asiaticus TaxID=70543 RepID=UPI0022230B1F|nr:uncharacterized protein LOC127429313 [Myxocyprinus asiaticus]